jgi:hypothetical protein
MNHLPPEREELIRRLHEQGRNYSQIERATGHSYYAIVGVLKGPSERVIKRKATRTIKCPSCGASHRHTIRVNLFKGKDLRDEA